MPWSWEDDLELTRLLCYLEQDTARDDYPWTISNNYSIVTIVCANRARIFKFKCEFPDGKKQYWCREVMLGHPWIKRINLAGCMHWLDHNYRRRDISASRSPTPPRA